MRRVDGEGLVIGVPCSSSLQSSYVRAVAQFSLSVAANVLVRLCGLEELLVLLRIALISQRDQEHALMQTVRTGLRDELVGNRLLLHLPAVFHLQLPQLFGTSERRLKSVDAAGEVVLRFVEDLLGFKDLEDGMLLLQAGFGEEEVGDAVDIDIGFGALLLEQFCALRARGDLEVADPLRDGSHAGSVYGGRMEMRGYQRRVSEKESAMKGERGQRRACFWEAWHLVIE